VGYYIWYSEDWAERQPAKPWALLAVPNVTAHTHQQPVYKPITVLLYNGPLLCDLNASLKV